MRVCMLAAAFPSDREPGRAAYLAELADHMSARCQIEVLCPRLVSEDPPYERLGRVRVRRFHYGAGGKRLKSFRPYPPLTMLGRYAVALRRLLCVAAQGVDVIYAHWLLPMGALATCTGIRDLPPVVSHLHGSDVNRYARSGGAWGFLARAALARSAAVLAVSESLANWAREQGHGDVQVQPMGVGAEFVPVGAGRRTALRSILGVGPETRVVAFVGDPTEAKGFGAALDAVGVLGANWRLVAIGPQPRERHGQLLALGPGTRSDVARLLQASDVLCLPSRHEGAPLAVMEARACGLPVVASALPSIKALVGPSGQPLLVPRAHARDQQGALVSALARAVERPKLVDCDAGAPVSEVAGLVLQTLRRVVRAPQQGARAAASRPASFGCRA